MEEGKMKIEGTASSNSFEHLVARASFYKFLGDIANAGTDQQAKIASELIAMLENFVESI
jgi:hypothetical protein